MKIGILSLVLHTNYGGILQSYALQTVLERMGHEVVVLDKDRSVHRSIFRKAFSFGRFLINKYIFKKKVYFATDKRINQERLEKEQYTQAFINKYIHTRRVRGIDKSTLKDVDAIVVGSDQVWRSIYFKKQWKTEIEDAFLRFAGGRKIKRIAYAASFGTDVWEYNEAETQKCNHLLQKFNAVSVREQSGVGLCEKHLGRNDVKWILDPTMLLSKEDYESLIPINMRAPGDLMCYVLDDNPAVSKLIKKIAEEDIYKVFNANSRVNDASLPVKERIQPPVEQWLVGFRDARLVITDSFHACVFSILFHKPFLVIGNRKRGYSRFESLLKLFGLEKRLIEKEDQFEKSLLTPPSADVYKRLEEYRKTSMEFLNKHLE